MASCVLSPVAPFCSLLTLLLELPVKANVLNMEEIECVLVGALYKAMPLKPNVLKEYSEEVCTYLPFPYNFINPLTLISESHLACATETEFRQRARPVVP